MIDIFVSVLIVLIVVGLLLWAVKKLIPLEPPIIPLAISVLCTAFVVLYVLAACGLIHGFPTLVHHG